MADDSDDLLSPEEIEALLRAAQQGTPLANPAARDEPPVIAGGVTSGTPRFSPPRPSSVEETLQHAEEHLARAMYDAPPSRPQQRPAPSLEGARAFDFQDFGAPFAGQIGGNAFPLDTLQDVELDIRIELGRAQLLIDEVLHLREGSVVALDKLAGDPVDVIVNGKLLARGEVLVLNDNFCVRVAEILNPE